MKTSVSFWDALFGERVTLEIPLPDGTVKKVKATQKWLEQMEREGKMKQVSSSSKANQPDPLLERAKILLQIAQLNAEGMLTSLTDRFPILRQVDIKHSEFVLTVAGVFMAASRLNNLRVGEDREAKIMEVVGKQMDQWQPDAFNIFEDCKKVYESEYDRFTKIGWEPRFIASDAVGVWIVLNILGRAPKKEECQLVRALGGFITAASFDWWDK